MNNIKNDPTNSCLEWGWGPGGCWHVRTAHQLAFAARVGPWMHMERKTTPPTRVWSKGGVCGCWHVRMAHLLAFSVRVGPWMCVVRELTPPTRLWSEGGVRGVLTRKNGPPTRACSEGGSMGLKCDVQCLYKHVLVKLNTESGKKHAWAQTRVDSTRLGPPALTKPSWHIVVTVFVVVVVLEMFCTYI